MSTTTSDTPVAAPAAMLPTKNKSSSKPCRYGTSCRSAKCNFLHPSTTTFSPKIPSNEMHVDSTATTTTTASLAATNRQNGESSVPTKAVDGEAPPQLGKNAMKKKKRKGKSAPANSTVPETTNVSETLGPENKDTLTPARLGGDKKKDLNAAKLDRDDPIEHAGTNGNQSKPGKAKRGVQGPPSEQSGKAKKSVAVKKLCRNGNKCLSTNCRFRHLDMPTAAMSTDATTAAASRLLNNDAIQQQQDEGPVTVEADRVDRQQQHVPKTQPQPAAIPPKRKNTTNIKPKANKPCHFGAKCHKPYCKFVHPETTTTTTEDQLGGRGAANVNKVAATVTPDENILQGIFQGGAAPQGMHMHMNMDMNMNGPGMWANELEDRLFAEAQGSGGYGNNNEAQGGYGNKNGRQAHGGYGNNNGTGMTAQEQAMWASDLEDRMLREARETEQKQLAAEKKKMAAEKKKVAAKEKRARQAQEKKQRQDAEQEVQRKENQAELERQQVVQQQEEEERKRLQKEEKRQRLEQQKADKEKNRVEQEKQRKRLEQEKLELEKERVQEEKERKRLEQEKLELEKQRLQEEKERQRVEHDKAKKENKRLQEEEDAIANEREEEEQQERLKAEKRRRVEMAREQKAAKDRRNKEEGEREKENVESTSLKPFDERTAFWEMEREKERKSIDMLVLFCAADFSRKVKSANEIRTFDHHNVLSDAGARAKLEESCEEAYLEMYKDVIIIRVHVTGMSQPADINDRAGTIERWSESKGKYYVGLDPKKNNKQTHFMYFFPGNLRAAPIQASRKGKKTKNQTKNACMVFASTLMFGSSLMCEVSKSTVDLLMATEPSSHDALLSQLMVKRAEEEELAKEENRRQQEEKRRREEEDRLREEEAHLRRVEQRRRENEKRERKRKEWEDAHEEYRRYQDEQRAAYAARERAQERAWREPHDPSCRCEMCRVKQFFFDQFFFSMDDDDFDGDDSDGWDRRYDAMDNEDQAKQDQEAAELLGVDVDATQAEIRRQYKRSVLKYHPDKHTGAENHEDGMTKQESEDHFKNVVNAYDHLMLKFDD